MTLTIRTREGAGERITTREIPDSAAISVAVDALLERTPAARANAQKIIRDEHLEPHLGAFLSDDAEIVAADPT